MDRKPEFPACAGMNRPAGATGHPPRRVPRMRGDEPQLAVAVTISGLEFPACAGMNRMDSPALSPAQRVPRMRGDQPVFTVNLTAQKTSSPHARG